MASFTNQVSIYILVNRQGGQSGPIGARWRHWLLWLHPDGLLCPHHDTLLPILSLLLPQGKLAFILRD